MTVYFVVHQTYLRCVPTINVIVSQHIRIQYTIYGFSFFVQLAKITNLILLPLHMFYSHIDEQSYSPTLPAYRLFAPALLEFFHTAMLSK